MSRPKIITSPSGTLELWVRRDVQLAQQRKVHVPDKRFAEAVEIELGVVRSVASARSAAQALLDVRWPRRGPRHRDATEACLKSLEGQRPSLDAHSAFVEAAREAGILKFT